MFTVLICSKKIIEDCQVTYNAFLKPLLEHPDWEFCEWNPEGDSLNEATEKLRKTVAKHKSWRAVIAYDESLGGFEGISRRNPFDVAGSVPFDLDLRTEEEIEQFRGRIADFRERKEAAFEKAVENPLTKLTSWLLGAADKTRPDTDSIQWDLPETYEGEKTVLNEIDRYHARCYEVMHEFFSDEPQIFSVPDEVVLVSERFQKIDNSISAENNHVEFEYSRFYEDNMYHRKLRYILYDTIYMNRRRDADAYFNYLVFLLTYAGGEHPTDTLKPERVYCAEAVLDTKKISEMCHRYIFKLQETKNRIDLYTQKLDAQKKQTIDNATATRLFESEVIVPVKISSEFSERSLMSKHDEIGLATDCPGDEKEYWNGQIKEIRRQFSKYLREPQRAVKNASLGEFRRLNSIDDNRVLRLNDTQREDIRYKLLEEEENMVKSSFSRITESSSFHKKLDEADLKVKRAIRKRMTRRQSVAVSLLGTFAFALGFLPWIIGAFSAGAPALHQTFSIAAFLVGVGICLLISFMMLVGFRSQLVSKFREFNLTMDAILLEIDQDLSKISDYLSHACNVMREFSVLNAIDSDSMRKRKTLNMHTRSIDESIAGIYQQFFKYIDENLIEAHAKRVGQGEAYEYDFTKPEEYEFEIPYASDPKTIEFMQPGYTIEVPIDYLKKVTLRREELYD